jgi:thiopeptide-type bacteriocin biosynthesis protein
MNRPWISLYIYYHQDPTQLLINCLQPLVNDLQRSKLIKHHFFVRYWEGGPHVRFRVLPLPNVEQGELKNAIVGSLKSYLNENPSRAELDLDRYAKTSAYLSQFELGQTKQFEIHGNNTIREVEYIPEYQSYGGKHAMSAVEQQFSISSKLGLQMLQQEVSPDRRIGRALFMMLSGLFGFTQNPNQLLNWFTVYNRNWMPALQPNPEAFVEIFQKRFEKQREHLIQFVDQVIQPIAKADGLMRQWQMSMAQLNKQLYHVSENQQLEYDSQPLPEHDVPLIALNCLHMHNNRIGISLYEEAYLTFLLKEALHAWVKENSIGQPRTSAFES